MVYYFMAWKMESDALGMGFGHSVGMGNRTKKWEWDSFFISYKNMKNVIQV